MKSYWDKRIENLNKEAFKDSDAYVKELRKLYEQETNNIQEKIYNHLTKIQAEAGGISLHEAKKLLNDKELDSFKMDLNEFMKKSKGSITPEIERELNIVSRRVRISRLQAMEVEVKKTVASLMSREEKGLFAHLGRTYERRYYKELYELQRIMGYRSVQGINKDKLKIVLNNPWTSDGKEFSERIWGRGNKLTASLGDNLMKDIARGTSPEESIKNIEKEFGVSRANAARLVYTETAAISSKATQDSFINLGVKKYQILATLDLRTSDICRDMDNRVFDVKDYKIGITAPPFHPNCRSDTIPYFDDDIQRRMDTTRMARNPETGKSERVPYMNYKEWYDKYVDIFKVEHERTKSSKRNNLNSVNWNFVKSKDFKDNINKITDDKEINNLIHKKAIDILEHRQNTDFEDLAVIDRITKKVVGIQKHSQFKIKVTPNKSIVKARRKYNNKIVIHNHPSNLPPSGSDFVSNYKNSNELGVIICHNGDIYVYKTIKEFTSKLFDLSVKKYEKLGYNQLEAYYNILNDFDKEGWIEWKKISIKD